MGVTQIPNPAYAIAIAMASQAALQVAIAHHGIEPNNPDRILTSINFSPQQFISTTTNILPTIDAPSFVNLVGEFFRVLELKFSIKNLLKNLLLATFFR